MWSFQAEVARTEPSFKFTSGIIGVVAMRGRSSGPIQADQFCKVSSVWEVPKPKQEDDEENESSVRPREIEAPGVKAQEGQGTGSCEDEAMREAGSGDWMTVSAAKRRKGESAPCYECFEEVNAGAGGDCFFLACAAGLNDKAATKATRRDLGPGGRLQAGLRLLAASSKRPSTKKEMSTSRMWARRASQQTLELWRPQLWERKQPCSLGSSVNELNSGRCIVLAQSHPLQEL